MPSEERVRLEFGNLDHIILARRGRLFQICADKATLQGSLSDLRTEYDPESKKMIVPDCHVCLYKRIHTQVVDIEGEIQIASRVLTDLEAERTYVRTKPARGI